MPELLIELTEDAFDAQYPLIRNHINPYASWAFGDEPNSGCLFETYGKELEFVRQQNPRTIWTLIDGDDSDQYVVSGYHLVNRIGYLISKAPLPEGIAIQVHIPMQADGDSAE